MTPIIIQARTGSQRWPGKVLEPIDGIPMIDRVIAQCNKTGLDTFVAIPENDEKLICYCTENNISFITGSENDLIDRYYTTMTKLGAIACLRITCDCPFLFPQEVLWVKHEAERLGLDFCTNGYPPTRSTPDGIDCEYYSMALIKWMRSFVLGGTYHEHLPLWLYDHWEEVESLFAIGHVDWPVNLSKVKFSIDSNVDVLAMKEMGLI